MKTYQWQSRIRFHQADPAGWMFFGRAFELAHTCLEDFLVHAGIAWESWFHSDLYAMPIRKAEADYQRPLPSGQVYEIQAFVEKIGNSSVAFVFQFLAKGQICLVVKSTHVLLDLKTQTPAAWPPEFRQALTPYLHTSASVGDQ